MDSSELTDVQQRILAVIRESMQARNYAPSMREIGEAVGLSSTASVSHQLNKLDLLLDLEQRFPVPLFFWRLFSFTVLLHKLCNDDPINLQLVGSLIPRQGINAT